MSIGDFARMTTLSVKALRHYQELGLLAPAEVDRDTGYRRYDVEQIPAAQVIRRLRDLGMPLDGVRSVIAASDVPTRNQVITAHLRRMEGELQSTRATVASLRLLLDEAPALAPPVDYLVSEASDALVIREVVDTAAAADWLGQALAHLQSWLDEAGIARAGPDGALYSSGLLEDEIGELTALVPVATAATGGGRIEGLRLPRVEYAVAIHHGSLGDIDRTYGALGRVVAQRAIGVHGPIREDYLVGSTDTPDEQQHRTRIGWPVFQTVRSE